MSAKVTVLKRPARLLAKLARGASGLLLVLAVVAVLGTMLVPPLLGYDVYAVDGGSMEPTIHRGALAYTREVPVSRLEVGDVITYIPPGHTRHMTHRIIGRTRPDPRRGPIFRTKGDANPHPDMRIFRLDRPTQARYEMSVPYAGWVLLKLREDNVKMIALGLPGVLIALWVLLSLWREGGRVLRERELAEDPAGGGTSATREEAPLETAGVEA